MRPTSVVPYVFRGAVIVIKIFPICCACVCVCVLAFACDIRVLLKEVNFVIDCESRIGLMGGTLRRDLKREHAKDVVFLCRTCILRILPESRQFLCC